MSGIKMAGIALIAVGILGLAYRGFSYTEETHGAQIGSLHLTVNEQRTLRIPTWAGVGTLLVGSFLLLVPKQN